MYLYSYIQFREKYERVLVLLLDKNIVLPLYLLSIQSQTAVIKITQQAIDQNDSCQQSFVNF